ncbi:MAG: DMT family transporter [Kiloniellales bacterium]|nr:DMT family transporter [Kiloniellales bacterium]
MGPGQWAQLIALSLLWGGSFFFAEVALEALPPLTVVLARVALGALALLAVVRVAGLRLPREVQIWRAFFVMGALNNLIPFSLIVWGQTAITGGLAAILNATTPLFTVVLAHWLTRDEHMTPAKLAGVAIGFLGVAVMIGPAALGSLGLAVLAQIAVLGAAVSYAFAGIYGRRFRDTPPLITAAGQVTASTLLLCPLALAVDRPWALAMPGPTALAALLGLGLLSTAAAYVIYFRILARSGATNLLLVTFLIPVSAILLGALILDERLTVLQLAGMGLIALGLAAIDGRMLRRLLRARGRSAKIGR